VSSTFGFVLDTYGCGLEVLRRDRVAFGSDLGTDHKPSLVSERSLPLSDIDEERPVL